MEKRFTVKDFILFVLMIVLIVSVWLAMAQYDRQWEKLQQIQGRLNEQGGDLRNIQLQLVSGVAAAPSSNGGSSPTTQTVPTTQGSDPFARLRAARQMPGFAAGGVLVDAFGTSVGKLTPLLSTDAYAAQVQSYVLESLIDRDPDTLEWKPLLSTSWKIVDHADEHSRAIASLKAAGKSEKDIAADPSVPPATQIVFKMRNGVRFSDGLPLTADDVVFSYQFIMDERINSPRDKAYLERITKVEKTAPDEVTFTLTEPYFESLELCGGMAILPKHFYGKVKPEEFNNSVGLLLGSGPYRMEDPTNWKPGTLIQLVRNERYWGVTPAFDRMIWREISNDTARLAAFRNGDIDLFPCAPEQYANMLKDAGLGGRTQHFAYQNPIGGYRYVGWNELKDGKPTLFSDVRVRRAMTMLLDRKRMIDQLMLGQAVEATGPFNPLSKQYNADVKPWPYDPQKAMALLKEAGFSDGNGTGILQSREGVPFRFKLTYPSGSPNIEKASLFMKDAFARAGIVMELDPLDWTVMMERLQKKNFDAVMLGWTAGIETDIFQMFHSSQAMADGDNAGSYKSAQLDRIMDEARRTLDEPKRMALWKQAHQILHEDQPYTFLFFPKSLIFMDGRIKNVQVIKLGLNPRVEWFVPKGEQRQLQ